MLFKSHESFEERLRDTSLCLDKTGKLADIVIDYLYSVNNPVEKFVEWMEHGASKEEYCNEYLRIVIKEDKVYKYFTSNPNELLSEISHYLAFMTIIVYAEEMDIIKKGTRKKFMEICNIFWAEGETLQIGYISKKLENPKYSLLFLKDVKKILYIFEKLTHHGVFLVHGDLKLENILVTKDGKICIIDFGLSLFWLKFEDGTVYNGRWKKKAHELMYVDPLILAITFSNTVGSLNPGDEFGALDYYDSQNDFIKDMYYVAYDYFYNYHKKICFSLDEHFTKYLSLWID